jgi:hypothetical protein
MPRYRTVATFTCEALETELVGWGGRTRTSNLCIRNRARLGLPPSCGAKNGSRSCAGLPAGACTICPVRCRNPLPPPPPSPHQVNANPANAKLPNRNAGTLGATDSPPAYALSGDIEASDATPNLQALPPIGGDIAGRCTGEHLADSQVLSVSRPDVRMKRALNCWPWV